MPETKCRWEASWEYNGVKVIDCLSCGFKHQYPWPGKLEAGEFYESGYYENLKPKYLENVIHESGNRRMWAKDKLDIFTRLLKAKKEAYKILDVGCSFGTFLAYFKVNNWDVAGVEPSSFAARFAREENDLTVHEDLLENIPLKELDGPFDVIHIKETLDHLTDPEGFIRRCSEELLLPDGILCIETANQFSEMQMAVIKSTGSPMWWIVPDHVGYFDRISLNRLVGKYGFEVKHEMSTFPMELFPLMGENFITEPEVGPGCHQKRLNFENLLFENGMNEVRTHFYETLAKDGFGRGIIQISQK